MPDERAMHRRFRPELASLVPVLCCVEWNDRPLIDALDDGSMILQLALIGSKWSMLILPALAPGPMRNAQLKRKIG